MDIAYSVNGVPIRLTEKRWRRIIERHDDLFNYKDDILEIIERPEYISSPSRGFYCYPELWQSH